MTKAELTRVAELEKAKEEAVTDLEERITLVELGIEDAARWLRSEYLALVATLDDAVGLRCLPFRLRLALDGLERQL